MKLATGIVVVGFVCSSIFGTEPEQRTLTLEDRVAAQKAIEQIYWNHRIWPEDNPAPKPSLAAVMSDEAIRAKVEDYLEKSSALDAWWKRPITSEQLQAELDRMAKGSRDPQVLHELFAALGNDPRVIAETLARQTLANRLIRNWYASDTRFHAEARGTAEPALAKCSSADCMKSMGGEYRETTLKLRGRGDNPRLDGGHELTLDSAEWNAALGRLAAQLGATPDSIPLGTLSRIEETAEAFVVSAVLARKQTEIVTASVVWRKQPFDSWWASQATSNKLDLPDKPARFKLPALPTNGCQDDTWSPTRQDFPDQRARHATVWTGTEMIVWGGDNNGVPLNTGGRYNPSTDSWTATSMRGDVAEARSYHTAVWTGTEMIVWGGAGDDAIVNTGGRYDPAQDAWRPTSTGVNVPSARYFHTAVWTGTEMIVWGGAPDASGGRYNPWTDSWLPTSMGDNAPTAQYGHTAVWTGAEMIVWGGYFYNGDYHYLNTGGRYDPSTDTWMPTSMGAFVPTARYLHTAVWTGTEMIVWGGYNTTFNYQDVGGRYNPINDSWTATSTGANLPAGRTSHTAIWTGTEMLVWGGSRNNTTLKTGGLYRPSSNTWRATSTGANVPSARFAHSSVWTGTEMIIWGGSANLPSGYTVWLSTGARYNPVSDAWVPTSSGQTAPTARADQTAIWTGAEFCVWGGMTWEGTYTYFNTGGCYDPSTDSWRATSIDAGTPAARRFHTAVWTGTEMIVWGGSDSASIYDTGGRYSPSSGVWTATSMGAFVPTARDLHTAVWSGTEMIVWGGRFYDGNNHYLNTGGRYDPSTDNWTPTSLGAFVPDARELHTAVWTGTEMIVWGGVVADPYTRYLNTGGRYEPSTDNWTPTSQGVNVPVPRESHTAVWTGTQMIIWGGWIFDNGYYYYDTGGRYSPWTNTWRTTSTGANVPEARSYHTAVWTGLEMIVWGGYRANAGVMGTGGRYNPLSDSWTPTNTAAIAASEREKHSAVWTGKEMIVWGGWPSSSTGGLYCAHTRCFDDAGPVSCDDGNPCTDDACDLATGCIHVDNVDACDDGNACTSNDACNEGMCLGHSGCEDGLPCTDDAPDPAHGCACSNPVSLPGTTCNDGNRCTLGTVCDGLGGALADCGGGTVLECNDGNPCTDDTCDPAIGCLHTNGTSACDDGNVCTTADTCGGGSCHGGPPRDCDDGNVCTDDSCDDATGCVGTANWNTCDDGNACNGNDSCYDGLCYHSYPYDCNDNNPCTTDTCNPAVGCIFTSNTNPCDDGSACTVEDTCGGGSCRPGTPRICHDDNPCTRDTCQPGRGCVFTSTYAPCNDGNACTVDDVCDDAGSCTGTPVVCHDFEPCTTDSCDPATGCVFAANTGPCDDGNACTTNDACGPSSDAPVFDENFDEVTAPGIPDGWSLWNDDGPIYWETQSGSGESAPNSAFVIDYGVPTDTMLDSPEIAIPSAGLRLTFRNRWSFEDAVTCYDAGVLEIGIGYGPFVDIEAAGGFFISGGYTGNVNGSPRNNLSYRSAWCNTSPGYPAYITTTVALPAAAAGQAIRLRWRLGSDSSVGGVGQNIDSIVIANSGSSCHGTARDCNDDNPCTDDSCNPATGCTHTPGVCDDGNACTTDACSPVTGCSHVFIECNDQNSCTSDSCNPATGCVYAPISCDDGSACTNDVCAPTTGCTHTTINCNDHNQCTNDSCNPATGICVFTPVSCSDGNACTVDACDPASGCSHTTMNCNDHNTCTNDSCSPPAGCAYTPISCNDGNACTDDSCDQASGCVHTTNTSACDDGNACSGGDTCGGGICHSGTPVPPPPETQNVAAAADKATYSWSPASGATQYDLVRGSVGAFSVGPGGSDEVCFNNIGGTTAADVALVDAAVPAPGTGFWYLSRGVNTCGIGTWGIQSNGSPRVTTTCR